MSSIKRPKAQHAADCQQLEQLPNVGPAMAGDLRALGIQLPVDLIGQDAYRLYRRLEQASGKRQDPCVLDTFMAIVDFMNGAAPQPWWAYTPERKRLHGSLHPA
jgi:Pathogenicity locus